MRYVARGLCSRCPASALRCSASAALLAVLRFCSAARAAACWQILPPPWVLVFSPAVLCCSAFCFYRALAWLLALLLGFWADIVTCGASFAALPSLLGDSAAAALAAVAMISAAVAAPAGGGLVGSAAATSGGGFVAISGALQTCAFKQIASLNFCRYIGGGGGFASGRGAASCACGGWVYIPRGGARAP